MKAAVVHEFGAPLRIDDVEVPTPGPGEVLVKVEASGLCHTDIHAAHGDWPVKPQPPVHPRARRRRHRRAGRSRCHAGRRRRPRRRPLARLGVRRVRVLHVGLGDAVPRQRNTGYTVDGGYAEYVLGSAAYVGKVPEGIDPLDAAPLTCAGVTTYKAVKVSGARSSDLVAVFGVGGLGHLALQYARIAGASVVAVDVVDEKLQLAKDLGAEYTVNAATEDPAEAIQALGGADAAIALAAAPKPFEQAYGSLRRGGRLVFVGLPADNRMSCRSSRRSCKGSR